MNEVKILNIGGSDQNIKDQYARNIIAPSENNLTAQDQPYASRDYDEGDYLIGQDRNLYKALTDIHTGDILAVNVNIKATTISDELVALEDSSVEEALEVIAYTENSSLSTRAYAVGDNLYWNYGANQGLYKATTAIAIGDAFTVGSNIEAAEPIAKQLEVVEDTVDPMLNVLGAKNILPCQKTSAEVIDGVTFTPLSDGKITISGTARGASSSSFRTVSKTAFVPKDGQYVITGNSWSDGYVAFVLYDNTAGQNIILFGGEQEKEATLYASHEYYFSIAVGVGTDISPAVTFYPMIRPKGTDDTYVPYAMTNRELTNQFVVELVSYTESTTVAHDNIVDHDFTISKNGYTPIGVVGYRINGVIGITAASVSVTSSTNVRMRLLNTTSSNLTAGSLEVYVLYSKV